MLSKAMDAEVGTSPLDTTIAVLYESAFKQLMRVVEIKVMDNPVTKMGSEHLTTLGISDNKAI